MTSGRYVSCYDERLLYYSLFSLHREGQDDLKCENLLYVCKLMIKNDKIKVDNVFNLSISPCLLIPSNFLR